jgi:hypothetical protein
MVRIYGGQQPHIFMLSSLYAAVKQMKPKLSIFNASVDVTLLQGPNRGSNYLHHNRS